MQDLAIGEIRLEQKVWMWKPLVALTCVSSLLGVATAKADQVDDFVRQQMQKARLPGVTVVVSKAGKIKKLESYGLANVDLNVVTTSKSV
jgi:CubicO group peptidase (beta-lactamase class C family)